MKTVLWMVLILLIQTTNSWAESEALSTEAKSTELSDYMKSMKNRMSDEESEIELSELPSRAQSEDQIPLGIEKSKAHSSKAMSPFQKMMFAMVGLLAIVGSFFLMIRRFSPKLGHASVAKNIEVITQKSIGPKKNLMLIRVAGETILLGVTDHSITPIKTLALLEDELPDYVAPQFSQQLKTTITASKINDEVESVDGFSVSPLDDVKSALKKRFSI